MPHPLRSFAGALLLAARVAHPQPAPAPPEAAAVAAIPAAEIPARAEAASAYLRALESRLQPEQAVLEIEAELPERARLISEAYERDAPDVAQSSLRGLENLRQSWLRRRADLEAWQATLQARLESLAQEQKTLEEMDATWRATRTAEPATPVPDALARRVRAVVADITRTRSALNGRFDTLLSVQDRVSRLQVQVGGMLKVINEKTAQARSALLRIDSPPLWEALRAGGDAGRLLVQLRESVAGVRAAIADWYAGFAPRVWLHAAFTVVLAWLIVLMRRRTSAWRAEDRSVAAAMHVLGRPIASALLVALILLPWVYRRTSVVIAELAALVVIVPMLRLLPGLVYGPMRRPLYGLTALYALSRLHTLVPPRLILDRLMLLVVAVLALLGLLMLLRPGAPTASLSRSAWWRWAMRVGKLAAVVLAASLVANLVGAVALAELLVEATLASALIGAVLLAAVLVLKGMVTILLRTRCARALHGVRAHGALIESRIAGLLHGAGLLAWLVATAILLNVGRPLLHALSQALAARWTIGAVDLSLGDVLAFAVGVYLAVILSRFIRFVLQEDVLPRLPLARGVPNTITVLVNYGILGLGFLIALAAAGIDLTRLTILAGALGVGVGFGLQDVVKNFVSGLILAFERPVQIGDVIEVGQNVGEVRRIGIRSSTIRTAQGAEVIVPNGSLVSTEVVNWTLSDRERRLELKLGVAYGNDPARVVELLHETVLAHPLIRKEQPPIVTFDGFGESTLDFTVRYWGNMDDLLRIGSEVGIAVYHALGAAGIEIPFPQRDLRLRSVDAAAAKALRPGAP
jgi:small-conductance mechanosensitive channel